MSGWAWENYWLIFATTAYVACPWIIAALTVPRLPEVYSGLAPGPVVSTLIFGFGWGLGAVLFGLGVDALGAVGLPPRRTFSLVVAVTEVAAAVAAVTVVREDTSIDVAISLMAEKGLKRLPVLARLASSEG